MLRIVDESGEDYLYPKAFFRAIALPQATKMGCAGSVTAARPTAPRRTPMSGEQAASTLFLVVEQFLTRTEMSAARGAIFAMHSPPHINSLIRALV